VFDEFLLFIASSIFLIDDRWAQYRTVQPGLSIS